MAPVTAALPSPWRAVGQTTGEAVMWVAQSVLIEISARGAPQNDFSKV